MLSTTSLLRVQQLLLELLYLLYLQPLLEGYSYAILSEIERESKSRQDVCRQLS